MERKLLPGEVVEDYWGQLLAVDDASPRRVSEQQEASPSSEALGEWDCSTYLSRSSSGYFHGTNIRTKQPHPRDFDDAYPGTASDLNSRSMSWFPSESNLFRGISDESAYPSVQSQLGRTKSAPLAVEFDTSEVLNTTLFESDTHEFLKNIFAADTNDFHEGWSPVPRSRTNNDRSPAAPNMPTYDSNPWSVTPASVNFSCRWSADAADTSPDRASNASNARIRESLDRGAVAALPLYCPRTSSYYLGHAARDLSPISPVAVPNDQRPFTRSQRCLVFQVHFKHYYRDYLLHPFMKLAVHIGDLVRVDADRGEDIGHVTAVSATNGPAPVGLGYIMRLATAEEKYMLPIKAKEEWAALEMCKKRAFDHQLAMNILDAEYQFDRKKLTFFFEAGGRIDFRSLVPNLFSTYKTRIWMQQVSVNSDGEYASVFA